jgi:hypothetical protein
MSGSASAQLAAPDGSAFYVPPRPLPDGQHGDVIWSRALTGPAALEAAASNELVLYRSTAVDGTPIGVSGIVALPPGPAPAGGVPVVSWAHGTLGSADVCAPSRDTDGAAAHVYNLFPHVLLNAFIQQGWAVAMTDYEGLGTPGPHPYLLGLSEARGILDVVRAARALRPELSSVYAVVGHSQGGQAALFAGHHRDWTPELRLCGVGAIAGDPSIDPAQVLTDAAYALWPQAEARCRIGLSQPDSWGGLAGTNQLRQPPGPSTTAFLAQLDAMHPDVAIAVPIRVAQAVQDQRVRAALTTDLVAQLTARNGAGSVVYQLYPTVSATDYPDLGYHFGTIETDLAAMVAWLTERFASAV